MSKAANDNGSRGITYLREGMGSGLKILVSAVQSRPCPPLFSTSCASLNLSRSESGPDWCPTRAHPGAFQRIPTSSQGNYCSGHHRECQDPSRCIADWSSNASHCGRRCLARPGSWCRGFDRPESKRRMSTLWFLPELPSTDTTREWNRFEAPRSS